MAIPAIATAVADLTEFALTGQEFDIAVVDKEGDDWAFKALKFRCCYVTSAAPIGLRFERYNIVGLLTVTAYTVPSPSAM